MTAVNCSEQAEGLIEPIIDRNRCEAKGECVRVCPYDVFEIHALTAADRVGMSLLGRIKSLVHGNRQAFAVHAEHCRACGLCVQVCPEKAIKLRSVERA